MHPIFTASRQAWQAWQDLRTRRRRFKSYTYGRQWDDIVRDPQGNRVTERELAEQSGKKPLTNNMIRQLVKCVIGRFRSTLDAGSDPASADKAIAAIAEANSLDELDCRLLEEFLISGCAIQRVVAERRPSATGDDKVSVWVDNVSPARFFANTFTDPRGADIELIGMIHDMSLREVQMRYGHGDLAACRRIADIYGASALNPALDLTLAGVESDDSFSIAPPGRCRVIEAWALEARETLLCHDHEQACLFTVSTASASAIDRLNSERAEQGKSTIAYRVSSELVWRAYYFAPDGTLLHTHDSPWAHRRHPFAVKLYPLTDGEIHPFVEDIIDQQRYINRLITVIDHILSFSAKGALLYPVEAKPSDMLWSDVARRWSRPDGVITYSAAPGGAKPEQVFTGSAATSGAHELLATEMKLLEQISGVSSALQGQTPAGQTSAALYDAQIQNAAVSLLDIFHTFHAFRRARNTLLASTRRER